MSVIDHLGSPAFWDMLESTPESLAFEVCKIDLVNLEQTLEKHPALRAWVNAAHETAKIQEERAKWVLTRVKAKTLLESKAEKDPHTDRPKTVAVLEAEVETHEDVLKATDEYLDACRVRSSLRAISDALEDRKDMLIQLGAKHRQEARDY